MANHNQFSSPEQKVEWLLRHRSFLVGTTRKKLIVAAMKRDGLVSKTTLWQDLKLDEVIRQAKLRWWHEHNGR